MLAVSVHPAKANGELMDCDPSRLNPLTEPFKFGKVRSAYGTAYGGTFWSLLYQARQGSLHYDYVIRESVTVISQSSLYDIAADHSAVIFRWYQAACVRQKLESGQSNQEWCLHVSKTRIPVCHGRRASRDWWNTATRWDVQKGSQDPTGVHTSRGTTGIYNCRYHGKLSMVCLALSSLEPWLMVLNLACVTEEDGCSQVSRPGP